MNEFVGKKLGEVLAFSRLGVEMFERGGSALRPAFDDYDQVIEDFNKQAEAVEGVAATGGTEEVTMTKAEATGDKLRGMMETYIGDEWDNTAELLEWMGFFEGAAVVHWRLVEGAASSLQDEKLFELAKAGAKLHHTLLHKAQDAITELGAQKAKE